MSTPKEESLKEVLESTALGPLLPGTNRYRLSALVAAGTKLDAAARLVKEAAIHIEQSGLLPKKFAYKTAAEIDNLVQRVAHAIGLIP